MSTPTKKRKALIVKAQESAVFTAHLASDRNPFYTACGEPWQGWQAPFNNREPELPPHRKPEPGEKIRQCQACLHRALEQAG